MADAPDLGSGPVRGGGSNPLARTMVKQLALCPTTQNLRKSRKFSDRGLSQSASCKRIIRQQTLLKEELYMRKIIVAVWVSALLTSALSFNALADEKKITGEGKCAKCVLKETASCQNVIEAKEGDKTVTYYLVQNDVSKEFHDNICKKSQKVTATGTVKEVEGKLELTATKIELVKN